MSQPLLSVSGLMMRFGGLLAVNNVSLELRPQEIVSLIGPNGAGKTTVFNCLTGFYKPTGGTIMLRDQHLEGLPGQQIARMGVVRTFQHVRLFREMTVIENPGGATSAAENRGLLRLAENPVLPPRAERSAGSRRDLAGAYWPAGAC